MYILAVDATNKAVSVALLQDDRVLSSFYYDGKEGHAETLQPALLSVFAESGLSPSDIDMIAAVNGPGSFTGIRIGLATVKGLAFGRDIGIYPVSSLQTMAYECFLTGKHKISCTEVANTANDHDYACEHTLYISTIDAKRDRCYLGVYEDFVSASLLREKPYELSESGKALHAILEAHHGCRLVILGDMAAALAAHLAADGIACQVFADVKSVNAVYAGKLVFLQQAHGILPVTALELAANYGIEPSAQKNHGGISTKNLVIREAKPSDLASLMAIEREVQITAWSENNMRSCLSAALPLAEKTFAAPADDVRDTEKLRNTAPGSDLIPENTDAVANKTEQSVGNGSACKISAQTEFEIARQAGKTAAPLHLFKVAMLQTAEANYKIAGFCVFLRLGEEAELLNLAVALDDQNMGIAGRLLQYCMTELKSQGVCRLMLEVRSQNPAAIHLYEKLGFVKVGVRRHYYLDTGDDAILYDCNLAQCL